MQVTFTLSDKLIKSAISNALENEVYDYWDAAIIKAAALPKESTVVNEIFKDAKFQASLMKELIETAQNTVEDCIYDLLPEIQISKIAELNKACEKAGDEISKAEQSKQEAAEVQRLVALLTKAGYKVTKA